MRTKMLCLALGLCLLLTGCSMSDFMEQEMFKEAKIEDDGYYQEYKKYLEEGKIDEEGYYPDENAENIPENVASISFAENSYLVISYYKDAAHTDLIETQDCYMMAGESIYADVGISRDVPSSMYSFEGFRLYQYKNNGRDLIDTIEANEEGFVLKIDDSIVGADYIIEPIGNYGVRKISLNDYYTGDDGIEHSPDGTWLVDDETVSGDEVEINPVASYIISYEYDPDKYFYISSEPQCYYNSNEDGMVIFELMEATDESIDYSVQLNEYISIDIGTTESRVVKINDSEEEIVDAGNRYTIDKLKYGDKIKLTTDKEWPQLSTKKELIIVDRKGTPDRLYEYTLLVPQKGGEFKFNPAEYSYEHGKIEFKCFGEKVEHTQYLAKGTPITYRAISSEDGYWLPDGKHVIYVDDEAETRAALNNIKFVPETKVTVELPQPDYGGKIIYSLNGKQLNSSTLKTASGVKISMEFEPWPGWISNYTNGEIYEVDTKEYQEIRIQKTKPITTVFDEDSEHQPELEVVLNKSIGENMNVTISTADTSEQSIKYKNNNWLTEEIVAFTADKIGTHKGINLSFGNKALDADTAVKIQVDMMDKNNRITSYNRLVNNLTEKQSPIMIYDESEIGVSEIWYDKIKINISIVDCKTFTAPQNPANGTIDVRVSNAKKALNIGDLIEPSEEVTVTIQPDINYYVSGKDVKNDKYESKMKYTDYLKNVDNIIDSHPVEKYIKLTLNRNDQYGMATYFIGKEEVSGFVRVKNGTEITCKYKVTASGYSIEGGSGGFFGIGKTDKEKTATLAITSAWEGRTINKSSFGIRVIKGGIGND